MLEHEDKVLLGGAFHYFRIPPTAWEKSINILAGVLDYLDLYIPWGWHEPEDGTFDFEGKTHPMRNLKKVLDLARKNGIKLTLRPGPTIYAEYRFFGYPKWLLKNKEILQQSVYGHKWKYGPNFHHPLYLEKANRWITKILEFVAPYDDIIIGYQIDNETGLYLADSYISPTPTIRDASPLTRKMFKERTGKEFPRPKLGWRLRGEFRNFGEMMMVQDFMEWWIVEYLKKLRNGAFSKIPSDKLFLNDAVQLMPPSNFTKKVEVAPVFFDLYPKVTSSKDVFDEPFLSCYGAKLYSSFSTCAVAECQCGWFDPNTRVKNEETLQLVMDLIAHGAQSISLYIAQDCIEDDGTKYIYYSLLDPYGNENPRMEVIRKIRKFLDEWGKFIRQSEEIVDGDVAIIEHAPAHRSAGSDSFIYATQFLTAMGIVGLLEEMGHNPRILLAEKTSVDELLKYRVLIFPSNYFIDQEVAKKLEL
ncbi:MAG: beta-galactosidase, partial [Candidatus Korarchaeota archaeon]